MRILFICNEYPPLPYGGIGIFVKLLSEQLVQKGHEVFVHCMHNSISKTEWVSLNDVKVFMFRGSEKKHSILNHLTSRLKQSKSVKKIVQEKNIDIVESYEWAGPLVMRPNAPLIIRLHGGHHAHAIDEKKSGSRMLRFFEKRTLQIADHIVGVSQHMIDLSEKAYGLKKNVKLIYNFYNPNKFHSKGNRPKALNTILFVGKFHVRKGVYEMFDRLKELMIAQPDIKFKFIGGYQAKDKALVLDQLPREIVERIDFVGRVPHDELYRYYQEAAFTLVPSRAEAFGLIAIEAMACGSIVIMSDGHVSTEIIQDGKNGFRIDFKKENALLELFNVLPDHEALNSISMKAIDSVSRFQMQDIVQQNIDFYQKILDE